MHRVVPCTVKPNGMIFSAVSSTGLKSYASDDPDRLMQPKHSRGSRYAVRCSHGYAQQCREQDSNLHTLRYQNLNLARLPIPPSRLRGTAYRGGVRRQDPIACET